MYANFPSPQWFGSRPESTPVSPANDSQKAPAHSTSQSLKNKGNFMNPNLTPYPINALPQIIRDAVYDARQNRTAPDSLIASSALGAISLVCQDKINVRRKPDLLSPVSLFQLAIAGTCERKSTIDKIFLQAVRDYEAAAPINSLKTKRKGVAK